MSFTKTQVQVTILTVHIRSCEVFIYLIFELQVITERKKKKGDLGQSDYFYAVSITRKPENSKYTRLAQSSLWGLNWHFNSYVSHVNVYFL